VSESSKEEIPERPALEPQDVRRERESAPPGRQDTATRHRGRDVYLAMIATLIGFLALIISGYTAYVQRQQLRAQVWPYIAVSSDNVPPDVGFHVTNSGTGPARVTAVRVTVDKRPVPSWWQAQKAMGAEPGGVVTSQLSSTVVPAGKVMTMIRPYNDEASARFEGSFLSDKHAIIVTICYCSVLDECWVVTSDTIPEAIAGPDACPILSSERFKQ
jgi:hypothetical protein